MSYVCTGARVFVPGLPSRTAETSAWGHVLEGHVRRTYETLLPHLYWKDLLFRVLAFSGSEGASWTYNKPALFLEILVGSTGTEKRLIVSDKRLFQHARQAFPETVAALIEIAQEMGYYSIELSLLENEEIELDAASTLALFGFKLTATRVGDALLAPNVYTWYSSRRRALVRWPPDDATPFG